MLNTLVRNWSVHMGSQSVLFGRTHEDMLVGSFLFF